MASTAPARAARICMPTSRTFSRKVFECGLYEAQDVLAAVDDVDFIGLQALPGFRTRERWLNRLLYHDASGLLHRVNPGLRPTALTRDYELFLAMCQSYEDLLYVNAIENWKARCRVSVCWIDEIWAASLHRYRRWLPIFDRFDHVLVSHRQTAERLSAAIGRPVRWVPAGVDVLRFSPPDAASPRPVDAYSIGRRAPGIHAALRTLAQETPFFYVYDTLKASVTDVYDPATHREVFAGTAKRSRFFLVAPPKFDEPEQTQGQVEIGYRYYEGAAAGCVLVGQAAPSPAFDELFGWPDAVIELAADGSNVARVLAELASDPARLAAIARRNAVMSLRNHDWTYRWKAIVELAGLPPSEGMCAREAALARHAARLDPTSASVSSVA